MSKISDTWRKKKRMKKNVREPVLTQRELKRAVRFQLSSAVIGGGRRHSHHCGAGLEHPWGFLHPADPVLARLAGLNNPPQELPWKQSLLIVKTFSIKELIRP